MQVVNGEKGQIERTLVGYPQEIKMDVSKKNDKADYRTFKLTYLYTPEEVGNYEDMMNFNEFDIAFQDNNNYLNYLSNKGNLNWKKKLSGKIIGDIEQIDIYKNGRLQLLFRTSERLYLLDRNGNEVEELTIDLDGGININPLSVFDYEKNLNHYLLYAFCLLSNV